MLTTSAAPQNKSPLINITTKLQHLMALFIAADRWFPGCAGWEPGPVHGCLYPLYPGDYHLYCHWTLEDCS